MVKIKLTSILKTFLVFVLGFFFSVGTANAWSLKEAAAPYKGTTIRIIGEALAPLESLNQQKKIFEDESKDTGSILQEIQSGYMLGDRLLRPALVNVAKKKTAKKEEKNQKNADK